MQVLHVIGPVGAGKTVFLKRFFPTWTLFDIKDVYRLTGGQPADLHDPVAYGQFAAALRSALADYFQECENINQSLALVESSGINQALNNALRQMVFPEMLFTLWMAMATPTVFTDAFLKERPYALDLNKVIGEKFATHQISYDAIYDATTNTSSPPFPTSIAKYFSPKEANLVPKAPSSSIRFVCAHCHADFSKDTYLLKHYDRFPACQPKK